jgi:diacylglycerol kinase (ATP)
MMILVNPLACGGMALKRWRRVESSFRGDATSCMHLMNGPAASERQIREALDCGETEFLAVGGDGTLNRVLNLLMTDLPPHHLSSITLGAVGVGSSNDFHKPFCDVQTRSGIPVRADFENADYRDVGVLDYDDDGCAKRMYFLSNASAGVLAEANRFFSSPDPLLRQLKARSTALSICYAAAQSVRRMENIDVAITIGNDRPRRCRLSTLSILKSPFISGHFHYPAVAAYASGAFESFLHTEMTRGETVRLALALTMGKISSRRKMIRQLASRILIESDRPFAVECDGEIVMTKKALFSILQKGVKVCS